MFNRKAILCVLFFPNGYIDFMFCFGCTYESVQELGKSTAQVYCLALMENTSQKYMDDLAWI